jgi:hypothetical protein
LEPLPENPSDAEQVSAPGQVSLQFEHALLPLIVNAQTMPQ